MSFKEVLAGKRKSPAAIFHKFRVDSTIHLRDHIFVEGYDDVTFYSRHTRRLDGLAPKFHICFGKKNLDDVAKMYWNSDIASALVLFIRDSDFDVFLGKAPSGRDFQLTAGYSVENYVCSPETIESYFREAFCLDEGENDFSTFLIEYLSLIDRFHEWLSPIYGAAIFAVRDGRHCDLNKLKADSYLSDMQNGDSLPHPCDIAEIESIGLRPADFNDESAELGRGYAAQPAVQWMRGKFILTATVAFLKRVEADRRAEHKAGTITYFNRKVAANMNEPAIFDRLSAMASAPDGLVGRRQFHASDEPANRSVP